MLRVYASNNNNNKKKKVMKNILFAFVRRYENVPTTIVFLFSHI